MSDEIRRRALGLFRAGFLSGVRGTENSTQKIQDQKFNTLPYTEGSTHRSSTRENRTDFRTSYLIQFTSEKLLSVPHRIN